MTPYKWRELVNVTRYEYDSDEWTLVPTQVSVGTTAELQFFRAIIPGEGKRFFDSPDEYIRYSDIDQDSMPVFSQAAKQWNARIARTGLPETSRQERPPTSTHRVAWADHSDDEEI